LLIAGGVHGDEFESMAAIRRLRRFINPDTLRGTLTLVPVVNEPAYRRQHRTAEDGKDLARTFPGTPDGAITERVAHAFAPLIRQADAFIDLHSGGTTLSCLPWCGYMLHGREQVLDRQRALARAFNLPIIWGTSGKLDGRSLSVARDASVPAIYAEYHGEGRCDPAGVDAYFEGCLNVLSSLGMIERPAPPPRVQHVIEDDRENSGYLQINNPAPREGYFEPAVALGQRVQPGDLLGTVCDVLGDDVREMRSAQKGIVCVLRTFPRVNQGDTVAVILEC
jgi:predicted deacylase